MPRAAAKRGRAAAATEEPDISDEPEDEVEEDAAPKGKKGAKAKPASKEAASKGKKRVKKDKNAPKRPLSAYLMYSNEKRNAVKEKHPDLTFTEIPKKIAEMWKALSAAEKQPYENMAADNKKKYEKEMEKYNATKVEAEDSQGLHPTAPSTSMRRRPLIDVVNWRSKLLSLSLMLLH
eukprot:TRINITY_DN7764_c0_g2_i1.p1 TRINITY_DN7764_c0_g2~~TRINITY_DN7764_c0_g2_i1.p1  ORF type:complete len:178 (-),score=36.81 TRINITY_DN7764_c0_g2_i1:202-735(-)